MNEKDKIRFLIIFGIVVVVSITAAIVFLNNSHVPAATQIQPPQPDPAPSGR